MTHSTSRPPKTAFLVTSPQAGEAGVTYFCPTCHHWLWKWFREEFTPSPGEVSTDWHGKCRLTNTGNPLRCNDSHDIIPVGPAPQSLLDWFDAGQPDWPRSPEDFIEGISR